MVVKTFRGQLADTGVGGQEHIRLQTIKGKVGYRIVKFQLINKSPGATGVEGIVKIYKTLQTSVDGVINFNDSDLLAAGYYTENAAVTDPVSQSVIFENEIFNQDIYLTYHENVGSEPMNYYLELEVIPLDDAGAEYTTLKDLRQV